MSIPNTNITQFASTTVHSATAHNQPHNELLANDNNLQTQVNGLTSTIGAGFILQLGQKVYSTVMVSTINVTNDTVWAITKLDSTSKLLCHVDVRWRGGVFMKDTAGSYANIWLRANGADQGDKTTLAFYNVGGEDWAAFTGHLNGGFFRIVTGVAGPINLGFRLEQVNYDGRITVQTERLTLTYAELKVSS